MMALAGSELTEGSDSAPLQSQVSNSGNSDCTAGCRTAGVGVAACRSAATSPPPSLPWQMTPRTKVGAAILRSICRIVREVDKGGSKSLLSLNGQAAQDDFQKFHAFKISHAKWLTKGYTGGALKKSKSLLVHLRSVPDGAVSCASLRQATRIVMNDGGLSEGDKEQIGFDMIRLMNEQLNQRRTTSWSCNDEKGLRICLSTVADRDNNPRGPLRYFYKVTVFNNSDKTYKLLGRHWQFYGGDGLAHEVPRWGAGVLGVQPVLEPKHAIEYTSCCTVESSGSYMMGALQFADITGLEVPRELDDYLRPEDDFNVQMRRWAQQGQSATQLIDSHIELLQKTIDTLKHAKSLHSRIEDCPVFTCDIIKTSF